MSIENLPEWLSAIGTVGATIAAIVIATYTFLIGQNNKMEEDERKKNEVLRYVFGILNDNRHRNARRRIINLYGENDQLRIYKILEAMGLSADQIENKEANITESKEIVKADFEEIGSLYLLGEIPKDMFIKIYWREVIKCWEVLKVDIDIIRKRFDKEYMMNFEYLNKEAQIHAGIISDIHDNFEQLVTKDIDI